MVGTLAISCAAKPMPTAWMVFFARDGHRIGYGAGYYDMTLTGLRGRKPVVAVGIAYAAQEVDTVPITPRDARLDLVLTENETIDFRSA